MKLLFSLLMPWLLSGAIAFDASSDSGTVSGASTSTTFSHTTSGSNRTLACALTMRGSNSTPTPTFTYNSVSMTVLSGSLGGGGENNWVQWAFLIAPASWINTVSVSSVPTTPAIWSVFCLSYTGTDQTTVPDAGPANANAMNSNGAFNSTVTVATANSWVLSAAEDDGGALSAGSGYTARDSLAPSYGVAVEDSNGPLGTGSQTAGWQGPAAAWQTVCSAISIRPTGAAAAFAANPTIIVVGP